MKRGLALILSMVLLVGSVPMSYADMSSGVTVKPLVVLMEYQDYSHTELADREDAEHVVGKHYDSYEKDLYEALLFGQDTYTSVDGQDYMTFRSYYNQMSHGLYDVDGSVFGWYMAEGDAKVYGADNDNTGTEQDDSKALIKEAVENVAKYNPNLDLSQFDVCDPYDYDKDGEIYEPDGEIDVVMVVHAGRGEEYGGGSLGEDAIWPVKNRFSGGASEKHLRPEVAYANTSIFVNDYLIVEQDFPVSLVAHEYAHYLGLPDLYRSGGVGVIEHYSNMAGGYPGEVPGTLIPSVGGYCRDELQNIHGGDWARKTEYSFDDIDSEGIDIMLSAASGEERQYDDLIRIDLPTKTTRIARPTSGNKCYFTGVGNNLSNTMTTRLDLTGASTAEIEFKAWYDIDPEFDYVSVQVRNIGEDNWEPVEGNITTTDNPNDETPDDPTDRNPGHGITGDSAGKWIDARFDLSAYAGKDVELKYNWWTDGNTIEFGMYIDDIVVKKDGAPILSDGADGELAFELDGFQVSDGNKHADQYYLLEWRNHEGVDENLKRTKREFAESVANKGLIVWYIDEMYMDPAGKHDQDTAAHPGHAYASVIDAGQYPVMYRYYGKDELILDRLEYQRHDAAFSLRREPEYVLPWSTVETIDVDSRMQPVFKDAYPYYDHDYGVIGVLQPEYGLEFYILEEDAESREAKIHVKRNEGSLDRNTFESDIVCGGVEIDGDKITLDVDGTELKDQATVIFANERFPSIIQTDVVVENKGDKFTGTLPVEGSDQVRMILGNSYFSGVGNEIETNMTTELDLRHATVAELSFKTWFDIDPLYDFGSVKVREKGSQDWTAVEGNITTTENPNDETPDDPTDRNPGYGISKDSIRQWQDAVFDLSVFTGKEIELGFFFWTDTNVEEYGLFVDDIKVTADGSVVLFDDAEGASQFSLDGFEKSEMTYRLAHIVFERLDGSVAGLYNKAVYDGYGVELTPVISSDNTAPLAVIEGPVTAETGEVILFSSDKSTDSDGMVVAYAWDFGDGQTGTEANPKHVFSQAGTYVVKLRVTDNAGASHEVAYEINVASAPAEMDLEPNNSFSDPLKSITASMDFSGRVSANDKTDKYIIRLDEAGQVNLSMINQSSARLNWTIVAKENTSQYVAWAQTSENPMTGKFDAEAGKEYYLTIYTNENYTSPYDMSIRVSAAQSILLSDSPLEKQNNVETTSGGAITVPVPSEPVEE